MYSVCVLSTGRIVSVIFVRAESNLYHTHMIYTKINIQVDLVHKFLRFYCCSEKRKDDKVIQRKFLACHLSATIWVIDEYISLDFFYICSILSVQQLVTSLCIITTLNMEEICKLIKWSKLNNYWVQMYMGWCNICTHNAVSVWDIQFWGGIT